MDRVCKLQTSAGMPSASVARVKTDSDIIDGKE